MTVEDLRGETVEVGDTIAYAAHDGRSTGMRIGTVLEIVEAGRRPMKTLRSVPTQYKDHPTMLRVQVAHANHDPRAKKRNRNVSLIHADMQRFVKVTP